MKYLVTQLVGSALATGAVAWAVLEHRRSRSRVPLIVPLDLRLVGAVLGWMLLLVPVFYAIFAFELIPKGSPLLFSAMLGWTSVGFVASLMALLARLQRRRALGWLTFVDEKTLRVETDGSDETVVLHPGSVRAYFTEKPQWLQFEIDHGERTLHLVSMVPIRELDLATEGVVVEARGPAIGASARRFCGFVRPYVTKD